MEELFSTAILEAPEYVGPRPKPKHRREPRWARVCGLFGGALLVGAGVGFVALGGWMRFS